ncbi:MAG: hypothetical protein R3195_04290 [Gemmatimonadota bacterium]|nr:hypothetical protein [Gemmatimonadota bacterium]
MVTPARYGPAARWAVLAAAILLGAPADAAAQDRGNPDWHYVVHPTLWFSNVDGEVTLDEAELVVGDSTLQAAFYGSVEVGKGRWRGIGTFRTTGISGTTEVELDGPLGDVMADYDFDLTVAELFAAVEFGSFETNHAFEFLGGLRYVRHALDVGVDIGTQVTREDWIEPVAGARYYAEMGRLFWATIDGNIGGFGIGSDISWVVAGTLGVRITRHIDATLAMRYYQTEFHDDATGYRIQEGVSQGWHIGLRWKG